MSCIAKPERSEAKLRPTSDFARVFNQLIRLAGELAKNIFVL